MFTFILLVVPVFSTVLLTLDSTVSGKLSIISLLCLPLPPS
nr:MAG TPA: hypothetical protein [Caudoviricetes sp.]